MTIPEKSNGQNIYIENREHLKITGVNDVISFDNNFVETETELGNMLIRGENLKIEKLNPEERELLLNGYFHSCEYAETKKTGKNIFTRIFR
ncbi:MAG: sporulation protein YabP [Ruminococcaceae bacterium]|nr:sporulation protein YabP [Oscillospiraceae bacterium]